MEKIRITKEFHFEMAHALHGYDGLCKNIHGHSYKLLVTLKGTPINDPGSPKNGMLIDFGDLKNFIIKEIIEFYDHSLLLDGRTPEKKQNEIKELFGKIHFLPFQPTCENLVIDISKTIKKLLPPNIELFSIRLYETETSYAEWFASDNE